MTLMATTVLAATDTVEPPSISLTDVNLLIDVIQTRTTWIAGLNPRFSSLLIPPDTRLVGSLTSQTYETVVLASKIEAPKAHNTILASLITQGWLAHRSHSEDFLRQTILTTVICHETHSSIEITTKPWGVKSSRTTLTDHYTNECNKTQGTNKPN